MAISEKCACSRDKCDESCEVYFNIVHQEKDTKTETETISGARKWKSMKVTAEILDYSDRMNAYSSPRVIVKDAWNDNQMVEITVGDKTVKVVGMEIIDAVNRCLNTNPVY